MIGPVTVTTAIERLERSTWDSRVMPSRQDVRILLDAMRDALADYNEPMSCLTTAERGEVLADTIAALARTAPDAGGE